MQQRACFLTPPRADLRTRELARIFFEVAMASNVPSHERAGIFPRLRANLLGLDTDLSKMAYVARSAPKNG